MKDLLDYLVVLLGKWHSNGLSALETADLAELERLMLAARQQGDERDWALESFADAMNSPRGDAADQQRLKALSQIRKINKRLKEERDRGAQRPADPRQRP